MSVYDAIAPGFDRDRVLPDGVGETIRASILRVLPAERPRILDVGAGTGRVGRCFVAANDDYTGVDLSFGMLRAFAGAATGARLAQADGARLPFADATFDSVLLVQVLSGAQGWRHLLTDAMRVLQPDGALIVGRVVVPDDGVDETMKTRLAAILATMDLHPYRDKPREEALSWLGERMRDPVVSTAAAWTARRSPAAFIARHGGGVRFSRLDAVTKQAAMDRLAVWAAETFGSLAGEFAEHHRFEMIVYRFKQGSR